MADIGYDGKVAIVTGAGGGLGRCHALELARRGARIVVNDLGGSVTGDGRQGLGPAGRRRDRRRSAARPSPTTASPRPRAAGRRADRLDAFGTVDIVINNAGILRDKTFHNMTPELLEPVIACTCSARSTSPSRRG
jgi:NAD(P)-dependent dehydrogenase (short-subunit alcohol dehydrogenase family)